MDTGPIYTSAQLAIDPTWRTGELMEALAQMGALVVEEALTAIANGVPPQKQVGIGSPAPKISKKEAKINWSQSADEILRKVRAFYPAPGAWSTWDGVGFKLTRAKISQGELSIGEISIIEGDVVVGCGSKTALSLLTVVPAGKKEMKAGDWARGARFPSGAHFG
jgi:methionyl-tRNA formyltransferase